MRLVIEVDQRVMRANAHDSTFGIREHLPLLAGRDAIVLDPPAMDRRRRKEPSPVGAAGTAAKKRQKAAPR